MFMNASIHHISLIKLLGSEQLQINNNQYNLKSRYEDLIENPHWRKNKEFFSGDFRNLYFVENRKNLLLVIMRKVCYSIAVI